MADDFISLAADGPGKKVDNTSLVLGANTVYRQRIVLGSDTNPATLAAIFPAGRLQVSEEPSQLFYDPFDGGTIDTIVRWTSTNGNSAPAPSAANSVLTVASGTTANGYSTLTSQDTFRYPSPSWLGTSAAIMIEATPILNAYRFFGFGTGPAVPTTTAPLTDAVGFEIATDGKLYAVIYNNGVRTVVQDMSAATGNAKQPTDGGYHRWILYKRIDRIYWFIDSIQLPVAFTTFLMPNSQILPIKTMAVAGATPPTTSATLINGGWSVWDTGRNQIQISDGAHPNRRATVKLASTAAVAADTALVVTQHPSSSFKEAAAPTSAITTPTITTATGAVLAVNANRRGATVYNESGANLFLALAATASLTSYTVQVPIGGYYEVPNSYSGALSGITTAGTAVLRVTEIT